MWTIPVNREAGQVLVQVAILVGVLFAFLALALDGGHFYVERRRMQNAADAGALAGARELCFGNPSQAEDAATNYAIDRNGAQWATATVQGAVTVSVVAGETMDTFLAGLMGIWTADVRAEAAAVCAGAVVAGGISPLAFKYDVYSEVITCGQEFLVFAQKDSFDIECAEGCECVDPAAGITTTTPECAPTCNCDSIGPHIGPGDRGWLQLFDPGDPYPDDCKAHPNCGAAELGCWIRNDHPGPLEVGDCIPGESGVDASVKADIDSRISDVVNIVLWDRICDQPGDPPPLGDCPGTPYHVAAFGCVRILGWEQNFSIPQCGDPTKDCQTAKNLKIVWAEKICDDPDRDANSDPPDPYDLECRSASGSSAGELPDNLEVRAVSLVK
jgi:hypothetical protein